MFIFINYDQNEIIQTTHQPDSKLFHLLFYNLKELIKDLQITDLPPEMCTNNKLVYIHYQALAT